MAKRMLYLQVQDYILEKDKVKLIILSLPTCSGSDEDMKLNKCTASSRDRLNVFRLTERYENLGRSRIGHQLT
jgi:hypothetical protein